MKVNPQDPHFDEAFDALCREMLSRRSVEAPPMAKSIQAVSKIGRKSMWLFGAVGLMGVVSLVLWNGTADSTAGEAEAAAAKTVAKPVNGNPEVKTEFSLGETSESDAPEKGVSEGIAKSVQDESGVNIDDDSHSFVSEPAVEPVVESVNQALISKTEVPSEGELTTEPDLDHVESVEFKTSDFPAHQITVHEEEALENSAQKKGVFSIQDEAPIPAAEDEGEPVLRLPLTLPSGGGH